MKNGSLPLLDRVHSVVYLFTPDGLDHGWMLMIAHDPQAGRKNRYSVFQINCQTGYMKTIGRELPIAHAKKIRNLASTKLISKGLAS